MATEGTGFRSNKGYLVRSSGTWQQKGQDSEVTRGTWSGVQGHGNKRDRIQK